MFAPSNRPQPGPRHHSTEAVSILSSTAAQSLLAGLTTPHASEFMYRPRPTFSRSTTAPAVAPHGLGFHVQQVARPAAPTLPPVGLPFERPVLPLPPLQPSLFSPASVYSSNSPESGVYRTSPYTSPSTDSLPSPGSPHDANERNTGARAWSGTPEWEDEDTYDSPVWGSRWARRNDSTVSDSLWGSNDGGNGSSLFSLSVGAGLKDVVESGGGRRSSTDSSVGGGGGQLLSHGSFLPIPRSYSRRSDSSVGSLFRFAGPAASITTRSPSPQPIGDGDGWDDISSAISDEVLGRRHDRPTFGDNSFGSLGSQDTRGSYDSAFQFDSMRRPSADSLLAPFQPASVPRRAAIVNGSLLPAPANAGAELLNRRNSAGSFTDYQIRRASFERRSSIGSHPLVYSVDPLVSPEADEGAADAFATLPVLTKGGRRESTQSELERESRLAFLMDLDRRVSQVVEVKPGGRSYPADQWDVEPNAIQSIWSPSTVATDTPDRLDLDNPSPSFAVRQKVERPTELSPCFSAVTASPSDLYSTLHANISLTFSFEERLSPLSRTLSLPSETVPQSPDLFKEVPLPDLSPRPLITPYGLTSAGRQPSAYFDDLHGKRPGASFSAFANDTDESEAETDPGCSSQLSAVEFSTVRRVELQMAAGNLTPPPKGTAVFDHATPRPLRVRNPDLATDEDDGNDADDGDEDMGYLAQIVRVLPTPQSSLTAAGSRGSQQQAHQAASRLDDFAMAFPRSTSTSKIAIDQPLARAPRLRAVQSLSSLTPDASSSTSSAVRTKFDPMTTFLSTVERPTSALGSERSVSPFTRPPTAQERRFSRGRRQAGAWELPWGAQLARSSVGSTSAAHDVSTTPGPTSGRRTSYVSQARPPTPAGHPSGSGAGSRRPSTAPSLPFEEVFVKQVMEETDTQVKVHVSITDSPPDRPPAVPPKSRQLSQHLRKPVPNLPFLQVDAARRSPDHCAERQQQQQQQTPTVCLCPLFFERVDGRRLPVAHPSHPPPPLPPNERTRSDPVLGPSAMAQTTIHDPRRSPVRFSVPRKDAPARPVLPRGVQSESAVSRSADSKQVLQSPLPPPPELKKRRSRAVLSRLFAKREKHVST